MAAPDESFLKFLKPPYACPISGPQCISYNLDPMTGGENLRPWLEEETSTLFVVEKKAVILDLIPRWADHVWSCEDVGSDRGQESRPRERSRWICGRWVERVTWWMAGETGAEGCRL